jgi:hypothetical protein
MGVRAIVRCMLVDSGFRERASYGVARGDGLAAQDTWHELLQRSAFAS